MDPAGHNADRLTGSQRSWLRIRQHMREHRYALAVAAARVYPDATGVAGTPLLSTPDWIPTTPIPLDPIPLDSPPHPPPPAVTGRHPAPRDALPMRPDGIRYARYCDAIADLAPPAVFEDRPTYRLLHADLAGSPRLLFGPGSYFAGT